MQSETNTGDMYAKSVLASVTRWRENQGDMPGSPEAGGLGETRIDAANESLEAARARFALYSATAWKTNTGDKPGRAAPVAT
jgi:hypothetical protein